MNSRFRESSDKLDDPLVEIYARLEREADDGDRQHDLYRDGIVRICPDCHHTARHCTCLIDDGLNKPQCQKPA